MTLAADTSPEIGRPKFLGLWRELSDAGQGTGPLILSAVTAAAGLAAGITVTGVAGFAAAAAMWKFIPRRPRPASRQHERQPPAPAAPPASRHPHRP
jgi:hypothetical protein